MAKGPWDVKFEEIDTPVKVSGVAVGAFAAICLAWLALADSALERGIAGIAALLCILVLAWGLFWVTRERAPSTSVGAMTVQVAQTEVVEDTIRSSGQVSGPDGTYFYVGRPPDDWRVRTMTIREFIVEEMGTNDEVIVGQATGPWPEQEILVMQSPTAAKLRPRPAVTTCFGRELTTALITDIKLQFVVAPLIRAQAPLFVDGTLEENFVRAIAPFSMSGVVRMVRMDRGRAKATGKRQWFAEFEQQVENVDVNGILSPRLTIRNSVWAVEGDVHDYMLRLTHTDVVGAESQDLVRLTRILSDLAESFTPLTPADKDRELSRIKSRADAAFVQSAQARRADVLAGEFVLAVTRFGGKDLSQPDVLLAAHQQFEVFAQWREHGDLELSRESGGEDADVAALFASLASARDGDLSLFKASLEKLVDTYYDDPAAAGATEPAAAIPDPSGST